MNFLNENNPFIRALTVAANLILLNWLLVLGCVPIFTAGASIAAAHTVCLQILREEDSGIFSGFLRAFRENFKQATVLWLFFLLGGGVLAADFFILGNTAVVTGILRTAVLASAGLLTALWLILWVNAFPLQARFTNSVSSTLKNSLILGIGGLPTTILMILLRLSVLYIAYRWTGSIPAIVIASMFILFSGIIYISDRLISGTLRRMLPTEEKP